MKKRFEVMVTRDLTESAVLVVETWDEDLAVDLALDAAARLPHSAWTRDDCSEGDPYIGDPDAIEEVEGT